MIQKMTYDEEITLVGEMVTYDEYGIPKTTETRKTVLCQKKSVTRNEFYGAAANGLKPEVVFVVHGYEYDGEERVEYQDRTYHVIRTYSTDFEEIELTCERD